MFDVRSSTKGDGVLSVVCRPIDSVGHYCCRRWGWLVNFFQLSSAAAGFSAIVEQKSWEYFYFLTRQVFSWRQRDKRCLLMWGWKGKARETMEETTRGARQVLKGWVRGWRTTLLFNPRASGASDQSSFQSLRVAFRASLTKVALAGEDPRIQLRATFSKENEPPFLQGWRLPT